MIKYTILILLLFAHPANAQSVLRPQHLTVEEGLSQSSVNFILQDKHGFMWFATGDGMTRYDGKEFLAYKSKFYDTLATQMRDRNINSTVFEDKYNKLWLSSEGGLAFLNTRNGAYKMVLDSYKVSNYAILLDVDDELLWAAVPNGGVYAINISSQKNVFFPFTDSIQKGKARVYPILGGVCTKAGIWILDKAGLLFFDKNKKTDHRELFNNKLNSIFCLKNGDLLLTGEDGVYTFNIAQRKTTFIPVNGEIPGKAVVWESAAEDLNSGLVYLGATNNGSIARLDPTTCKYSIIDFQKSPVNCLFIDRSQNLWVGTEGNGVYKVDIKPRKFNCFTNIDAKKPEEKNGLMVKSIYQEGENIWLGTYNNGLLIFNPTTGLQQNYPLPFSPAGLVASTTLKDSSGTLVVTIGSYVIWIDPISRKITHSTKLPVVPESSPGDPIIYTLIEWKKGHYLVGTNISLFALNVVKGAISLSRPLLSGSKGVINSHIYNLHQEQNGIIYTGKRNGYAKIRMLNDTAVQLLDEGFEHVAIRHFYKSTTSPILWIASEKGLIAYNETTRKSFSFDESNGLGNSYVYAILAQNDSTFWISTNQGLSNVKVHYKPDVSAKFINYTVKDGLQSNEFNTGAYYRDSSGVMYFGGIAGINWFNPNNIRPNLNKALPAIVEISVNDSLIARDTANYIQSLDLPFRSNTISISFRALEYTSQEQNRFQYMLEGLDKDWVRTANDKVRYSNLPPGEYTFLLKVSNNEGLWSDTPLTMQITVRPPYWQTWWFRLLIIIASVSLVLLAIRVYVKGKIKAKTRELEKQQALYMERLRISKDVHDDLGSGLSKISLMAEIAQQKKQGDSSIGNDMRHISAVSKELVDNMRDLIWVLNPENTTLEHLVSRLREYCSDYLENIPLKVTLNFPHTVPSKRITREAQRNIFLTTKEAINNCVKHAAASEISISLNVDNSVLSILIHDNGKGFDVTHPKSSGNGLRNMKQRIQLAGGTFSIQSNPGVTKVSITIPFEHL